jgi:hypothetical protein
MKTATGRSLGWQVIVFPLSVNTSVCDGGQEQKAPWLGTPPLTLLPLLSTKSAVFPLTYNSHNLLHSLIAKADATKLRFLLKRNVSVWVQSRTKRKVFQQLYKIQNFKNLPWQLRYNWKQWIPNHTAVNSCDCRISLEIFSMYQYNFITSIKYIHVYI